MKHWKSVTKNTPNKQVAIQFNVPRSTLSTWNQPISTIVCWIDCLIFWTTCIGNYRRDDENQEEESDEQIAHPFEEMKLRQSKLWTD